MKGQLHLILTTMSKIQLKLHVEANHIIQGHNSNQISWIFYYKDHAKLETHEQLKQTKKIIIVGFSSLSTRNTLVYLTRIDFCRIFMH